MAGYAMKCEFCRGDFFARRRDAKFCCAACRMGAHREKTITNYKFRRPRMGHSEERETATGSGHTPYRRRW